MVASTLCPGNCPPSPGLAPWAILICIMSELIRYSVVTPNRPEATCLIDERMESPFSSGVKRSVSSPPSPVLERPPRRFMAMASVVCISPRNGAERHRPGGEALDDFLGRLDLVQGHRPRSGLELEQPSGRHHALALVVDGPGEFPVIVLGVAVHGVLEAADVFGRPIVALAALPELVVAAGVEGVAVEGRIAEGIAVAANGFLGDLV